MTARDFGDVATRAGAVLDALDLGELGEIYFHEGGGAALGERLPRVLDCGIELAQRVCERVPAAGASLWVGAGIAELPVLLAEVLIAQRDVVPVTLRERECELLNAALAAAGIALRYVAGDARVVAPERRFDHVGCLSVFTDPETWPTLSGVAYGRLPPVQLDVETFVAERDAARALANALFARLQRPGLVTTTPEEVAWFLAEAEAAGVVVEADEELVETAIVGDPAGFLRIG